MISKPVPADSFYHTCRYVCQKAGAEVLIAEGVRGHDYRLMAEDFLSQQQMRPTKEKACFHSILSFHPSEKPSDEILKEIALKYLDRLGIKNTQVSVTKHTDRAHPHLHIIANMVDNDGKTISDSWIGLRGKKVAQQLTEEYHLVPAVKKDLSLTNLEALSQSEATKYKIYIAIAENLPYCRTMEELGTRLLNLGIETQYKYKGQTQEKQGVSFKMEDICFKGSQVDRKYSLSGLQKMIEQSKLQQVEEAHQTQKVERIDLPARQKTISHRATLSANSRTQGQKLGHDISRDLGKGLGQMIDDLMKAEDSGGGIPYELSQEAELRRKKKKKRPRW